MPPSDRAGASPRSIPVPRSESAEPDERTDREIEELTASRQVVARLDRELGRAAREIAELRDRLDAMRVAEIGAVRREERARALLNEGRLARINDRLGASLQLVGGILLASPEILADGFGRRIAFWLGAILLLLGFFGPWIQNRKLAREAETSTDR